MGGEGLAVFSGLMAVLALALAILLLFYSSAFFVLAIYRQRLRGVASLRTACDQAKSNWLVVIPALGHPDLLERCVNAALVAINGTGARLVVALDDGRGSALERGLEAVRRASGEEPAVIFEPGELDDWTQRSFSGQLVCVATGRLLPRGRIGGKAAALNLVLALQGLWSEKPRPDDARYLLCIDVDEVLYADGFQVLQAAAMEHPEAAVIQAPKHDEPVSGSWFGHAFSAGYSAWFHWEAGWHSGNSTPPGSSYYGSMAAVKLDDLPAEELDIALSDGAAIRGREVFPQRFTVEDYPFAVTLLADRPTVLLARPIGVGCAPPDTSSVLALWHRWAHGNVAAARWRATQIFVGPMLSIRQRVAWIYHSLSWYAYAALGLLPLALSGVLVSRGQLSGPCLAVICLAMTAEWMRRLVPSPMTSLVQRALRVPVDLMLWPVVVHAIYAVWSGASGPVSRSTPRTPGSRALPPIAVAAYSVETLVVTTTVVLAASRLSLLSSVACLLVLLPALVGLAAIALDSKLRLRA